MIDLFIIADDFTGALDTGVQFAARGVPTRVVTNPRADLASAGAGARVLVMDAETRHLSPLQAYETVHRAVTQAMALGVKYVYKKTDSALRGNIGAELTAVLNATGCRALPFLPAFPRIGRTTRGGVHYVDGLPVAQGVFGRDPFEPVMESNVERLIHLQCGTPVRSFGANPGAEALAGAEGLLVIDAQSDDDLMNAGRTLQRAGLMRVSAGCAGFGAVAQELLGLAGGEAPGVPKMDGGLLVICGSVNPITLRQLDCAEAAGFSRMRMSCEQKMTPGWFDGEEGQALLAHWRRALRSSPWCVIDANDAQGEEETTVWAAERGISVEGIRTRISGALGDILAQLFDDIPGTLLITGGDTLLQCMERLGVDQLEPVAEVFPGVVLSRFRRDGVERMVISKSGGFGGETLLLDLKAMIDEQAPVASAE